MQPIAPDSFAALVDEALAGLPEPLLSRLDNVAIVVDDQHPEDPSLLGLYEGIPQTERWDYAGVLPDTISLYRIPLCLYVAHHDELVEQVRITVVHELAHHMGIAEDDLHRLGWG